ncbi:MAG: PEP-CTERM sorting domain-containing protein [Armatimonadota bacterium]
MMRLLTFFLPLALLPATGAGQRFFDDFDGEDLGSHWSIGNQKKGGWIYSVHDSLLDVHGFAGFDPTQWIYASLPEYRDFDLQARVGWTQGDSLFQGMEAMLLRNPTSGLIARMIYHLEHLDGLPRTTISAEFGGGSRVDLPGPSNGFHSFRLARAGGQFTAYLDGERILQGGGTDMRPRSVLLLFRGRLRPASTQLYVDSVEVVPEPATAVVLCGAVGALALRRRRR